METTLFHRKSNGEVKVWTIAVDGNLVTRTWGQQGGQMMCTQEKFKANARMSAEERAQANFDKRVKRQRERGFVRKLGEVIADVRVVGGEIDFDKPLPSSFSPGKPFKTYDVKQMTRWERAGDLIVQRKRDGMRHHLVSDSKGRVRIYSSGKDDMTEHLQPLLEGIALPPRTILDAELVVTTYDEEESDQFDMVASIARSLPERARRRIAEVERTDEYVVLLFAFDILWHKGEAVFKWSYLERHTLLNAILGTKENRKSRLQAMPTIPGGLARGIDMVKMNNWEGLVAWHSGQPTMVHLNGTPDRCNCWKVKPIKEEDVVAYDWEYGKGQNENVVGKFKIGLMTKRGTVTPMGKCGTGLSAKQREEALRWKYPCVIQIEYDRKSDKGFRFPVFVRRRTDKDPSECLG